LNALVVDAKGRKCRADNCTRAPQAKGLCLMHYKRQRKTGSLESTRILVREGSVFHQLTAVRPDASTGQSKWMCICSCGKETLVFKSNLVRGHTKSCGCRFTETVTRHGHSKTKEYRAWVAMRSRCNLANTPYFKNYGGRGIRVCARWDSFDLFLSDMGARPSALHSVERNDVNGDYGPSNCCWAIPKVQARNKRCTVYVTINDQQIALADAAERSGLNYRTVHHRIFARGWSVSDALSRPAAAKYSRHGEKA
jgi:hypothetical protein